MSVRLDLLRHGETELGGGLRGSLDDALTELGWSQMRKAVIGQGPWDRIVSSPLQRCRLFAEELAASLNLPLSLEKDLQELHFGAWEGQSAAALMQTDEQALGLFWADPYRFTPPDGEPVVEFAERVLVVCHGGVIKRLLAQARGLPREQLLNVAVAHGALFGLQVMADGQLHEVTD